MANEIDISGLDKAAVLAALYNAAHVRGAGYLQARDGDMTAEQARELIDSGANPDYGHERHGIYFDYLYGRVIKTDISGDSFNPGLFDRDNGAGAAERAIAQLRAASAQAA